MPCLITRQCSFCTVLILALGTLGVNDSSRVNVFGSIFPMLQKYILYNNNDDNNNVNLYAYLSIIIYLSIYLSN